MENTSAGDGDLFDGIFDGTSNNAADAAGLGPGSISESAQLRAELEEARAALAESQRGRTEEREDLESRMASIKQKAKDHIVQLQEKMQQIVKAKDSKIQELEAMHGESCENDRVERLDEAEKQRAEAVEELTALRAQMDSCQQQFEVKLQACEEEKATLRDRASVLEEENVQNALAVKKASDECATLRDKLQSSENDCSSSVSELQLCREECAALKAKLLAAADTSEEGNVGTLKAEIQAFEEEIAALKASLQVSNDKNSALMAELQTHEEQHASHESSKASEGTAIQEMEAAQASLEIERKRFAEHMKEANNALNQKEMDVTAARSTLEEQQQGLEASLQEVQASKANIEDERRCLEERAEEVEAKKADADEQRKHLQDSLHELETSKADMEERQKALEERLKAFETAEAELKQRQKCLEEQSKEKQKDQQESDASAADNRRIAEEELRSQHAKELETLGHQRERQIEELRERHHQELEQLQAKLQEQDRKSTEVTEELARSRQEFETKLADVVRKAKEHVKQMQSRLEGRDTEHNELSEKHREVEEAFGQQQEKVQKYKQLMAQANTRIEEADGRTKELQEALGKSQTQRIALQEQMGSMEKLHSVPPNKEEIARCGGILLAVEAANDDVWCLIGDGISDAAIMDDPLLLDTPAAPAALAKSRWWLLSQLDVGEKPVPLQRRWKGEVSALRAQVSRLKKRCEELQEEFDGYKAKANAALMSGAAHSEEAMQKGRQVEQLGEQLQAISMDLQQAVAERGRALDDLSEARRSLQEAQSKRAELERALARRVQEGEEKREAAIESCRNEFEAQKEILEMKWSEKERSFHEELDLRRSERESLDEEVRRLRERLEARIAATPVVEVPELPSSGLGVNDGTLPERHSTKTDMRDSPLTPLFEGGELLRGTGRSVEKDQVHKHSPRPTSEPEGEAQPSPTHSPRPDEPSRPQQTLPQQALPQQAYSLHSSVAWQDLVNLRSQVRQLEQDIQGKQQELLQAKREHESAKKEITEMTMQQRLQDTVGQHQQMEYIRNVFRKFVESSPQGNIEHEQLIVVLLTFFKFSNEDSKAIAAKRGQAKSGGSGLWGQLTGKR